MFRLIVLAFVVTHYLVSVCYGQKMPAGEWTVIGPGGGGTTIGPTISPFNTHLVVERCDMTAGYVTENDGQSWRMFNLRGGIHALAFDPADKRVIFAGNAALWRSTDAGRTWTMLFPDPRQGTIEHQVGDHSDYELSSDDPVYSGGEISTIATDATSPKLLFVAFRGRDKTSTIVRSQDGGHSWKRLARLQKPVLLLVPQPAGLMVITPEGGYRASEDGTLSLEARVDQRLRVVSASTVEGGRHLFATTEDGGVLTSQDGGRSWRSSTPALGQRSGSFAAIATSAAHPEVAYVGFRDLQLGSSRETTFNGIAKTVDSGANWKIVFRESTTAARNLETTWIEKRATQDGESIFFDAPYSLGVAPTDPDVAYATDLFRTYRTLDGGKSWQEMNSAPAGAGGWRSRGLDVTTNYGVQFDPFDRRRVFLDNTDIGLFRSDDAGASWRSSSAGVPEDWRNTTYWLAFDPQQRGRVWGAFSGIHDLPRPKMWRRTSPTTFTGGVGVSDDGGVHWKPSGTGMPSSAVTFVLMDPESAVGHRVLYATAFGRGVYKSVDGGATWQQKNTGLVDAEPFAWRITRAQDRSLYLVVARRSEGQADFAEGQGRLYRSVDGAEHWVPMHLPNGVNGPTGLQVDPRDARHLYLTAWGREGSEADHGGGVYDSLDGGLTWRVLETESQHVYDVTIDPSHPDSLYISGFDAGAFRSVDGGAHWDRIQGYDFKWGHRVIIDPSDPAQIYITTYGGGVWHGPAAGDPKRRMLLSAVPIAH